MIQLIVMIAQLRLQLKTAQIEINYNFRTAGYKLDIKKAKLVRIKFPIELTNFYWTKKVFFALNQFYLTKSQVS